MHAWGWWSPKWWLQGSFPGDQAQVDLLHADMHVSVANSWTSRVGQSKLVCQKESQTMLVNCPCTSHIIDGQFLML